MDRMVLQEEHHLQRAASTSIVRVASCRLGEMMKEEKELGDVIWVGIKLEGGRLAAVVLITAKRL